MPMTVYKEAKYDLDGLLANIDYGTIALPDIQRPFVWSNARVRDLLDSMYKGFPVGYLLFWATGAAVGVKKIGTETKQSAPSLLIVDGQQRLTSLYAVMRAKEIVREDYSKSRIRIAFKPSEERFEVTDAAIEQDPEFLPDVSEVYNVGLFSLVSKFFARLEEHRGEALDEGEKNVLAERINRLQDLDKFPFQAIELDQSVDEEQVADVFVRINSEGVKLGTTDFILTLMSVFRDEERLKLEEFCRAAKLPSVDGKPSPFNHFIQPAPDELLITSLGLAFRRGRMQPIYSILRGKDLETGKFDNDRRDEQFDKLAAAQAQVLSLSNWHEFLKCLTLAGYRSARMISSDKAIMVTYLMWLIGKLDFHVPIQRLRKLMSRWWFMVHATGRYTGSAETVVEFDLNKLKQLEDGDTEAFCALFEELIDLNFTDDYWTIAFPARLDSASAKTPRLSSYWAALNILDAEVLFSEMKVSQMLDPLVTPVKDMERHHLFPRAHLTELGVKHQYKRNQIANMSFVDWSQNIEISDKAPHDYWAEMTSGMSQSRLERQMYWHALPLNWESMDYDDLLSARRKLISEVTKAGYMALCDGVSDSGAISVEERILSGESESQEFKKSARWSFNTDNKFKSEMIIVKTVAGFLNRNGGSLFIGVADDCSIVGLEADYETLSKSNPDGYELFLSQLISNSISGPANASCRIIFHELNGKDVCEIQVSPSPQPVFSSTPGNPKMHTEFWLREGNRTVQYMGEKQALYIKHHWK